MQAKKKKRSPYSRRKRFILTVIVVAIALVVLYKPLKRLFHLYGTPPGVTKFKTSLDPEFVPTAEYLIEHPEPDKLIELDSVVSIDVQADDNRQEICVIFHPPPGTGGEFSSSTEIYLNNRLTAFSPFGGFFCEMRRGGSDCVTRCAGDVKGNYRDYDSDNGWLESGVHLIEVRMKYHPDDEPFHVHQWAFEIK
jgi:hypothetical protein